MASMRICLKICYSDEVTVTRRHRVNSRQQDGGRERVNYPYLAARANLARRAEVVGAWNLALTKSD